MPEPIFAERPYLAPRKPVFRDPILGLFLPLFLPGLSILTHQPNPTEPYVVHYIYKYI